MEGIEEKKGYIVEELIIKYKICPKCQGKGWYEEKVEGLGSVVHQNCDICGQREQYR